MNTDFHECESFRNEFSRLLDGTLPPSTAESVEVHLTQCPGCSREWNDFRRLIGFLNALPPKEPVLDMWREIQPEVAVIVHEQRLPWPNRLRLRLGRIVSNAAAGAIVFTGLVARNTDSALRRFLVDDPFESGNGART